MGRRHHGPSLEALERTLSFKKGIDTVLLSDLDWTGLVYNPRARQMARRVSNSS